MLRWAKRNGGWPLNGGLWMGKSRKAKAKAKPPFILREKQTPRKEKAQVMAAKTGKASDALQTRSYLPVNPT